MGQDVRLNETQSGDRVGPIRMFVVQLRYPITGMVNSDISSRASVPGISIVPFYFYQNPKGKNIGMQGEMKMK